MHSGLELESRRRIYEYLTANPGVHLRRIGQALGMSTGMLSYHLGVMEKQGLLLSEAARHRRRYYLAQSYREEQRRVVALLRGGGPRGGPVAVATRARRERESVSGLRDGVAVADLILGCAGSLPEEAVGRFVSVWPRIQALRERQAAALALGAQPA